MAELSAALTQV